MAEKWTSQPGILTLLQRLSTLSIRLAQIDAKQRLDRAATLLRAHVPPPEKR